MFTDRSKAEVPFFFVFFVFFFVLFFVLFCLSYSGSVVYTAGRFLFSLVLLFCSLSSCFFFCFFFVLFFLSFQPAF